MGRWHSSWTWVAAAAAVLALTGWLYARPDIAIMLTEQLWSCFGV